MRRSLHLLKLPAPMITVLLHSWLFVTLDAQAACRDPTVTLELLKEGFHR